MKKNLNEIIIDKDAFTIDDAKEALEQLFSNQVDDFYAIKNEKWYKKLLSAITLGSDRKKLIIKDIRSLSKLQAILALVCFRNFQDTDANISEIIENQSKTNDFIKKIYLSSVVGIKPQEDINRMSQLDKDILLLTLEQYKSINGKEQDFLEYKTNVAMAIGRSLPDAEFECDLLGKVNSVEVFYRCLVELQMIDGTDTMPELISEAVDNLNISPKAKKKIFELTSREVDTFKSDYLVKKYSDSYSKMVAAEVIDDGSDDLVVEESESDSNSNCVSANSGTVSLSGIAQVIENEYGWIYEGNKENFVYQIEVVKNQELKQLIDNDEIEYKCVSDSIIKSLNIDGGFAYLYRFNIGIDEEHKHFEGTPMFMVLTTEGVYISSGDKVAFFEYISLRDVKQNLMSEMEFGKKVYFSTLTISADKITWYLNTGEAIDGENNIELKYIDRFISESDYSIIRWNEHIYMRYLRRFLNKLLFVISCKENNTNDLVEEIVGRYLNKISGTYSYLIIKSIDEFKDKKRKINVMSKYPNLRNEDAIAFIDTSVFKSGKEGILFGYDGIGFNHAFKRIFVKYSEILHLDGDTRVSVEGYWSEYLPEISVKYEINEPINALALRNCLEEILCVI